MNKKKTILHIIQNFGKGGAETTVVGVLKELSEYNNIVVALDDFNQFGDDLKFHKYYCLNVGSYYFSLLHIRKLRKIIVENNVDLVHSQLYWSTVLARFACPKNIPLVTSIQASLTDSVEYKKKWIGWLDKFSYKWRPSTIIGVSQHTMDDYFNFLKLKKERCYVLHNFVDPEAYTPITSAEKNTAVTFKMISVGSLKPQKNQRFLLEAFMKLKAHNISLDIYGEGMLRPEITQFIFENQLQVRLMGQVPNVRDVMGAYQLFVMSSLYEGFSLAVLEGMMMEIPMLLADIETFREQCADTAVYFSLNDTDEFIDKLLALKDDRNLLNEIAAKGKERVLENFTIDHHLTKLKSIYKAVLNNE